MTVFLLEKPMDRGAWRVTVNGVAKSQTQLSMQAGKKKKKFCLAKLVGEKVQGIALR